MLTIRRLGLGLALAFAACSLSTPPGPPFRIGIIGDQTHAPDLEAAHAVLARGVERLASEGVRLVLHTGDLVESSVDPPQYRETFARAAGILDRLGVPWYMTPGDHDVNPPRFLPDSPDRSREALFRELYGSRNPPARERLYYSFDAGGYHFIALYSHETLHADPRWGATLLAGLSAEQRGWLADDLDRSRGARGIVVFLHQPLWYVWTRWSAVHALLRQHRVLAVIAGHTHYNQDDGLLDGIRYVTVGAAGGRVKQGSSRAGAMHHVTTLTLTGSTAEFRVLPLDGAAATTLTPRADMDRVQMIDQLLGGLWAFESANPLFRKGDALVSTCDTARPARLALVPLGNPLDVPLSVTVAVTSAGARLENARFLEGACQTTTNGRRCELPRGRRVAIANLSSVETTWGCGDCAPPPPLWTATPVLTAADAATVTLLVRLAFTGEGGDLHLDREVRATIGACP